MQLGALHITDGESVAGTLRKSGLPGIVLIDGDMLYEGHPRPPSPSLSRFVDHYETILWFDHSLSNQLLLIRALDWYGQQDLSGHKLSVISGRTSFGSQPAAQFAALEPNRIPVDSEQFDVARRAWAAFASCDPAAIERVLATGTSALPFLADALARYLEEFPSKRDGLSRTQRMALTVLRERGPLSKLRLFFAVQRVEETPFMGDQSFYSHLDGLASAREPLIHGDPPAITGAGVRVLEGQARHL